MTDSHNTAHPNLEDLDDYVQGLAQALLKRDAQQQAHELKLSEVARLEKIDESARAIARRAEEAKVAADRDAQRQAHELNLAEIARTAKQDDADRAAKQQAGKAAAERAAALDALRLERARLAHLIDQVPSVAAELDAMIANADHLDPQRWLPSVRKELRHLPTFLESLSTLASGGLPQSDLVALHPKGVFQIGVAMSGLTAVLKRVPARGMGRFVKIGESGEHLPAVALAWVALLYTAKNLIFERKTESGIHGERRKFTNYGKAQPGDSGQYVIDVNHERFAGKSDWRMPTVDELAALYVAVDHSDWGFATAGRYWSSSEGFLGSGSCVNFGDGERSSNRRGNQYAVRLVRAA